MKTYPNCDSLVALLRHVELSRSSLDIVGASNGVHCVAKLDQEAISHSLDFPPVVSTENGSQQLPLFFHQCQRKRLVFLTQSRVASHVCEHYCCEPTMCLGQFGPLTFSLVQR